MSKEKLAIIDRLCLYAVLYRLRMTVAQRRLIHVSDQLFRITKQDRRIRPVAVVLVHVHIRQRRRDNREAPPYQWYFILQIR